MEFCEQYASFPFDEWISQRKSLPNWEAILPSSDQMTMMNYDLPAVLPDFPDGFLKEYVPENNYFPGEAGFSSSSPSLEQELNSFGGYCHEASGDHQLHAQVVMENSSYGTYDNIPLSIGNMPVRDDNYAILSSHMQDNMFGDDFEASLEILRACKMEPSVRSPELNPVLGGPKSKAKRLEGQPSKNLMAERRRRKRLNDRLSMLRSIVPKISKMDRTSILGDTIDYMKELLEKIHKVQNEIKLSGLNQLNAVKLIEDMKPNEMLVRNSPKFNVERRNEDTRVEICCSGKPGLLLSTVNTLESLGLDIQHCVISCFSDFSLHASCSLQELGQRGLVASPEDIKQALFRNAGYGGRCL